MLTNHKILFYRKKHTLIIFFDPFMLTNFDLVAVKDRILVGDCLPLLRQMPAACIDLVFADPPYNLQIQGDLTRPDDSQVHGVREDWDQFDSFAAYDDFSQAWLTECRRVLKPNGGLWLIGTYHNIFRLGTALQDLGFWMLGDIIWRKSNPMPNFKGTRFTNAHETLIWSSKSKAARPTFNYAAMKSLNDDLQMRSDWTLPLCTGRERIRGPDGSRLHPTQKPEALLYRVLCATTKPGDIVLDPFFGLGTTGAVAKLLNRHFIGMEQDQTYVDAAQARINAVVPCRIDATEIKSKKTQPRIPFGNLLEQGLIRPGTTLHGPARRFKARVAFDGTLVTSALRGSIHQVGAGVQGTASCNGWTFWHLDVEGHLVPLDTLRQKLRDGQTAEVSEPVLH